MLGSNVSPLGKMTGLARACLESQLRWFTSVCAASEDGPVVLRNIWKLYLWFLLLFFFAFSRIPTIYTATVW